MPQIHAENMNNSVELIQVEFHNRATELFFAFFHAFIREVSLVDRTRREFEFQKLKNKYTASFEQELTTSAGVILSHYKNEKQSGSTGPMLHQFITDYLFRFVQKIDNL
jgi:hypothetical protein